MNEITKELSWNSYFSREIPSKAGVNYSIKNSDIPMTSAVDVKECYACYFYFCNRVVSNILPSDLEEWQKCGQLTVIGCAIL